MLSASRSRRISRRRALQSIAAVSSSVTLLRAGSARAYAASEKLNIALVDWVEKVVKNNEDA